LETVDGVDIADQTGEEGVMQWCDKENNEYPDSEFKLVVGVRYHTRGGDHPADGDEIFGDSALSDAIPEADVEDMKSW
jgi:hypothetical protein